MAIVVMGITIFAKDAAHFIQPNKPSATENSEKVHGIPSKNL